MKSFTVLFMALFFSVSCKSQSDILILKRHNHTLQTFYPDSQMTFSALGSFYNAVVTSIHRDTVFLIQYDIRQEPTSLGFYILDTVTTYRFGIDYHDITGFGKNDKKFSWSSSGGALFGGGIAIAAVGLGTWIFTKPNTQYHAGTALVVGAAALAAVGYLLMKTGGKEKKVGKKYKLEYIPVK